MDDDLVTFAFRFRRGIGLHCSLGSYLILLNSLSDNGRYPSSKVFGLVPATIREGGIVGGRRREMPVFVGYIETQSVSV